MTIESFRTSGSSPTFHSFQARSARCRVAILGFGTVGSAVARRLTAHDAPDGLELTHILDRHAPSKRRPLGHVHGDGGFVADLVWTERFADVLASDADVVVEAIGGIEPAADWIRDALLAGKSVVTANKQVIARHGARLLALAERQGRQLRFEAAVGGAMPIVRAVGDGLAGDRLTRIAGVLNGTTNAVLSRMEATGCPIDAAVADVRARGFAEADPSADLDGLDAAAKLAILCAVGFRLRVDPDRIATRSVAHLTGADFGEARRRGCTIRQIALAELDENGSTLTAWVAPARVPSDSLFARAVGPQNAALVRGAGAGEVGLFGAGAGGDATAVAVVSDLAAIARDRAAIVPCPALTTPRLVRGLESAARVLDFNPSLELAEAV